MNINQFRKLAGLPQKEQILAEDVEFEKDATLEQIMAMMDAAKRAMSLAHKLRDGTEEEKVKKAAAFSRVFKGLNRIRSHARKLSKAESAKKATVLASAKRLSTQLKKEKEKI